jgi:hypothetical protein
LLEQEFEGVYAGVVQLCRPQEGFIAVLDLAQIPSVFKKCFVDKRLENYLVQNSVRFDSNQPSKSTKFNEPIYQHQWASAATPAPVITLMPSPSKICMMT